MPELKPCPWCIPEDEYYKPMVTMWRGKIFYVKCRNIACNVQPKTMPCLNMEDAEKAWNTRKEKSGNGKVP